MFSKANVKKHNMTYTLYCKITFWSKAGFVGSKTEHITIKTIHSSSGCVNVECAESSSSGGKNMIPKNRRIL